jgi:hypothetical protein
MYGRGTALPQLAKIAAPARFVSSELSAHPKKQKRPPP